jgi:DNA-binding GntR family transcriptional regulator
MTPEPAISRSVLSDQVKDRLLQAILDGRYPPGARIVETRVAREYGTSQAPVREALRDLEAIGVVETTAFRGARVRRPSAAELLEAYGVRTELEALAARLAIPQLSEAVLEELGGYVRDMRDAARTGDSHREAEADAAFHGRIVDATGNGTLVRVWRHLEPFSRTYISLAVPGADRLRIADLHAPVLEALRRHDPELAADALRRHFATASEMLDVLWTAADSKLSAPARADPVQHTSTRRRGRPASLATQAAGPGRSPDERTR